MTRSVTVTIILSLAIGCALSQLDMTTEMTETTEETFMETSTAGVLGQWDEWAEWATCNTTCPNPGGWRNRTRECYSDTMEPWQNAECDDTNIEWQECVCGEWSSWSDESTCSATCDGGFQTRQRDCQATTSVPEGAGLVCEGDAEEYEECNLDECPLDEEEEANGVYVGLATSMTVSDYIKIRMNLQSSIIRMVNNWCYRTAFNTCCEGKTKPSFDKGYLPQFVNNVTCELKGAFRDNIASLIYFFMHIDPDFEGCELCNGRVNTTSRRKRQALSPSGTITNAVANTPSFANAVTRAAKEEGFVVTVTSPLSPSAASSLKATLLTTTAVSSTTTARATAAPPSQLGLVVGLSVGGGLVLLTIILVIVVVVKKKMAKTGIAEITASGVEGAGHQHERRHRELEDGNVTYPAPQYPARGAVAPVSQS